MGAQAENKPVHDLAWRSAFVLAVCAGCARAPEGQIAILGEEDGTESNEEGVDRMDSGQRSTRVRDDDDELDAGARRGRSFDAGTRAQGPAEAGVSAIDLAGGAASDGGNTSSLDASAVEDATVRAADAEVDAAASATCDPRACRNNCLALDRCCNAQGECACEEPLTRQCSLASLPGPPNLPGP